MRQGKSLPIKLLMIFIFTFIAILKKQPQNITHYTTYMGISSAEKK